MEAHQFRGSWEAHVEAAVAFRRALHRLPELTWKEFRTAESIRAVLSALEIPWRVCAETGTVGLVGHGAGEHIALRADIDALPISEQSGVPWTSDVPGSMHACGHDGHTAALMLAGAWLKQQEQALPGRVTLLFQPAEEGGHGAKRMLEAGALEGVDAVYGWHNWPAIPFGSGACPDGPVMSANATFGLEICGKGGHASQPESCRDPLLAGAAVVMALQHIVSRRIAPQDAVVLSVTAFDCVSPPTVIRDRAHIAGSIRAPSRAMCETLGRQLAAVAKRTAAAYETTAQCAYHPRYGATINAPVPAQRCRDAMHACLGERATQPGLALPLMASEDFSYYLDAIPGAFMLLGASTASAHRAACHAADYTFNDDLLPIAARIFCKLAGVECG